MFLWCSAQKFLLPCRLEDSNNKTFVFHSYLIHQRVWKACFEQMYSVWWHVPQLLFTYCWPKQICPHHRVRALRRDATFAPKSNIVAFVQFYMPNNKKAWTLPCRDEIWASTYWASSKSLLCAPSPGVDLPFPCLYPRPFSSKVTLLSCGFFWSLLFVFRREARLQKLRDSKKVTADIWLGVFLVVLHRCTCLL